MEGTFLLTWDCMVEHLETLRDTLSRAASVRMLSMMSWCVDGRVQETKEDSPAVPSSSHNLFGLMITI